MDLESAILLLEQQGQAIPLLVKGITAESARWKPNPESWSVLEVLNHLVDEEILDFRCHLQHILFTPDQPWPKIDPMGWVQEKEYNRQDITKTLINFKNERNNSITWLKTLKSPNWESAVILPWGCLSAGDMLASWLAHDLLHLRQLIELRYQLNAKQSLPYRVEYAGEW